MNKLSSEKSLYLLEHKDNPVEWWPFGADAIKEAQNKNLPIFLSVGYSACHWCHVMAHESFSSPEVAEFLNKNFINIKVDREEHPDLDQYYQNACQIYTGRGGWPLSVFLTTEMKPFFVGTYFPLTSRQGMPSFLEVIQKLSDSYVNDQKQVQDNAQRFTQAIAEKVQPKSVPYSGHFPHPMGLLKALDNYADKEYGSYGGAPKFPHFAFYEWATEQILEGVIEAEQAQHITNSIEKMLLGGIYDHARGGIHRYSVDAEWLVPHFEKMLYDQAGLLTVLAKFSLFRTSPLIQAALANTLDYLEKEMLSEENYFFSAQDADSEGHEGLYFTYSYDEFLEILKDSNLESKKELILKLIPIDKEGNFENGLNIIHFNPEFTNELYQAENWKTIHELKQALLKVRRQRIPPKTDTKGLASWNFMLIKALIDVVQYAQGDEIKTNALNLIKKALPGIEKKFLLPLKDGRYTISQSTTREDQLSLFENFVFFAEMNLRLYEMTGLETYKKNGKQTMEFIFNEFSKENRFYTRSLSHENARPYPNQEQLNFDSSYKSPLPTLIFLMRKWHSVFDFSKQLEQYHDLIKELKDLTLMNPFGCGESLRALTYPDLAFKKIEVPLSWLQEDKFLKFLPYFSSRFALHYTQENNLWQFCTSQSCELTGKSLDEFVKAFGQTQEQNG
ncbi:MAG: thioredoxin domain-containing protein [Bacteriovoracaceae bacterium]|nr:thioredoxin domain-containing protein [Bacteriovoracaceae bacterium]